MVEQGKFADVSGIQTHYHEDGQGEPLLLIHGSGPGVSAWANWRLVFPILSEKYHLYAPDIVGFGYTDRPEGIQYSIDVWADHMITLLIRSLRKRYRLLVILSVERLHCMWLSVVQILSISSS